MTNPTKLVHARYLGTGPVVMPDLFGRDRCCRPENHRVDDPQAEPNPHTVLQEGDVILLDRWSAEGRSDFEVLKEVGSKEGAKRAKEPKTVEPEGDAQIVKES